MPFLVMTRAGWDDLLAGAQSLSTPIWLGAGVLTPKELADHRARGLEISVFDSAISHDDPDAMIDAMDTIAEHHPEKSIWVEFPPAEDE